MTEKKQALSPQFKTLLGAMTLAVAILTVFYPTVNNQFVNWDDRHMIQEEPLIRDFSLSGIVQIFRSHLTFEYSRVVPLTYLTYSADHRIAGENPAVYHLTSLILHLINTILVFIFLKLLLSNRTLSFCIALIFGIHPINTEAVLWVSARAHLLFSGFYFLTLILYLLSLKHSPKERTLYNGALAAFLLALLACGFAITLPFALLLCDCFLNKKITLKSIFKKIPFFLLAATFALLTLAAAIYSKENPLPYLTSEVFSLKERVGLSGYALGLYLKKLLIPYPLSCVYPLGTYLQSYRAGYGIAAVIALTGIAAWRQNRTSPEIRFGILFFLLTTLPFLHIFGASESIINDRYMYLPGIGFFLCGGIIAQTVLKNKFLMNTTTLKWAKRILIGYLIILAVLSRQRIEVWKNSENLWSNVIAQYPVSAPAYLSRGDYYLSMNQADQALADFNQATVLNPNNPEAFQYQGHALIQKEKFAEAAAAYTKALQLNPADTASYNNRANTFLLRGEYARALDDYTRAIRMAPEQTDARLNRGMLFLIQEKYTDALQDFKEVLARNPGNRFAAEKIAEIKARMSLEKTEK